MTSKTIETKWSEADFRPAGFDFLRVALSVSVILWHSLIVCYGPEVEIWFWTGPLRPLVYAIIPAFFALSGFLVAGSLLRNDLVSFFTLRVIRIFPALTAEVVLSAFILGPALTTYSLSSYFSDPLFKDYLFNLMGYIHYQLPGLFADAPAGPVVNLQLWTVPYELECYIGLGMMAIVGLVKRPKIFFAFVCLLMVALVGWVVYRNPEITLAQGPLGKLVVLAFLFGVAIFLLKDKIRFSFPLFLWSITAFAFFIYYVPSLYLSALPIAYATIYIGLLDIRFRVVSWAANYSYGLYLYGFPIQQVVSHLLPDHRHWYINFTLSFLAALLFAALSWHLLESKVMDRKKVILHFVHQCVACMSFRRFFSFQDKT